MAFFDQDEEIECEIIEYYGIFSQGVRFWNKELNLVSWNGRPAKLDIRNWQRDHKKCGKGIALTWEEAEELARLLGEVLGKKPKAEKAAAGAGKAKSGASGKTGTAKKAGSSGGQAKNVKQVPVALKPFYNELKLFFGAGPGECKTARNILLKKYHPDMYTGSIAFATRKTIKIKEAYEKIMEWWNGSGLA